MPDPTRVSETDTLVLVGQHLGEAASPDRKTVCGTDESNRDTAEGLTPGQV